MSWIVMWLLVGVGGFATELAVMWLVTAVRDAVSVHAAGRPRHRRVYLALAVAFFAKNLLSAPLAAWAGGRGFNVGGGYPWAQPADQALSVLGGYALDAIVMGVGVGNLAYWMFIRVFLVKRGSIPFRSWLVGLVPGVAFCIGSMWTHSSQTSDGWPQSVALVVLSVALLRFATWLKIVGLIKSGRRKSAGESRRRMSLAAWLGWGLLFGLGNWLFQTGLWVEGKAQVIGSALPAVLLLVAAMFADAIRGVVQDRVEEPFEAR